jgi:hypothetical protein
MGTLAGSKHSPQESKTTRQDYNHVSKSALLFDAEIRKVLTSHNYFPQGTGKQPARGKSKKQTPLHTKGSVTSVRVPRVELKKTRSANRAKDES